jgi:hypothetical protein
MSSLPSGSDANNLDEFFDAAEVVDVARIQRKVRQPTPWRVSRRAVWAMLSILLNTAGIEYPALPLLAA